MTYSQSVYGPRQPIKGCSAPPSHWRDGWSSYCDGFPMVSALVCMVAHWTGPMMSHDLRLSSSHNLTKMFHYVVS